MNPESRKECISVNVLHKTHFPMELPARNYLMYFYVSFTKALEIN